MMEALFLIVLCIGCLLYALLTHSTNDRLQQENALLRDVLSKIADGEANAYKYNGLIQVREIK